ncbi:MAG: MOSC N-terminal beta barrel domain-containing protein [Halobacteriales archaeon]|nr:MOSC N-terminal beta barrel domain-containing protein [Halobacteriales archaeon]
METAKVEKLRVYPVKSLGCVCVTEAKVLDGGTLVRDREFAVFDGDGDVVNGKRTPLVHRPDVRLQDDVPVVSFPDGEEVNVADERDRAERLLGDFFDVDATVRRDGSLGYVDRREMGPSVVSTATVREFASWFDITVESARRRLRANVEVSGVPAFWEDRFVGEDAPSFDVGGVGFEGVTPCGRCVVPARNPDTGEETEGFRRTFIEKRRETFPEWADEDAFDHPYTLMIIARVPEEERGGKVSVGDRIRVV